MSPKSIGAAIAALADCCAAVAGNIHTAHLNYHGLLFDTYHKEVTNEYYAQLDEDYDALAEWAACYDTVLQNKNEAAKRVNFQSFDGDMTDEGIKEFLAYNLTELLDKFHLLYKTLNKIEDCVIAVGVTNWLQDRIQYWVKEVKYFNARRS